MYPFGNYRQRFYTLDISSNIGGGVRRIVKAMRKVSEKIWGGRTSDAVLAKRFKIFVLLGIFFIGISKLLYIAGITFPNFELVIPTLIVVGSFSLYCGPKKVWKGMTRYFGIIALISVFLVDLVIWGVRPIYIFTWPAFVICWMLALRNRLSLFDKTKTLLWRTTLTAAIAIFLFDIFTTFGWWICYYPHTLTTLVAVYIALIPFALYHLCSLIFVPPLVGLGKAMVKVKVPVRVAVPVGRGVRVRERIR